MSYQYEPSPEEVAAAALLRVRGWQVSEPTCPDCHGFGTIGVGESWGDEHFGGGSWSSERCPRGCPAPSMFFNTTGTAAAFAPVNAIAGPAIGTRGVR